jgi:hypothetical protein
VFHASVAIGPAGDLTKREAVKELTFLPTYSKPLVAFMGVKGDVKHAIFLVSDDISSVSGDGQCLPRRSRCTFLVLGIGDTATLKYAPENDRTYRLRLIGIHTEEVKKPSGKVSGKRQRARTEASQLLGRTG